MRPEAREWLMLVAKTLAFIVGGVLVMAALVQLAVDGASWLAVGVLVGGLALALPPLAFAFRDAVGEARKGRL